MSTIVYQNSHSFFDTHLSEPRSLSLKLNHPQCPTPPPSVESLITYSSDADVYVHPTEKRSNTLSKRSLEMCTENLGSETGTDTTNSDDIFAMLSLDDHRSAADEEVGRRRRTLGWKTEARKAGYESLPPPLTTANTLRVQRRLESGRMVMTAVSACPRRSTIHAERSNGRLTMSLVEEDLNEETAVEEEVEIARPGRLSPPARRECGRRSIIEEEEEEKEGGGVIKGGSLVEEGKDGINVGGRIGIGEFQRPSRCNEGGHRSSSSRRIINWEPYCVAT